MDLTNQITNLPLGVVIDIEPKFLSVIAQDVPEVFFTRYEKNALLEYVLTTIINGDIEDHDDGQYEVSFA